MIALYTDYHIGIVGSVMFQVDEASVQLFINFFGEDVIDRSSCSKIGKYVCNTSEGIGQIFL